MKNVVLIALVLFLASCSDRSVGGPVYPDGGYTGNPNDPVYYKNEFIYQTPSGYHNYDYTKVLVAFDYTKLKLSVIAGNASMDGVLQVKLYGYDESELTSYGFDINGDLTQGLNVDLRARPRYVEIIAPEFSGSLTVVLNSVASF